MSAKRSQPSATGNRRGIQALELLFVVPVLAVALVAVVQCGRVMMIRSGITQAATVAAREAAKGGDVADVARAVNCVLAVHGIAITDRPGSGAKLAVQAGNKPPACYGDPTMSVTPAATIRSDEVLVRVWVKPNARRIDGRRLFAPAGDALGLLTGGKTLAAAALAKRQQAGKPAGERGGATDKSTIVLASRDATARGD